MIECHNEACLFQMVHKCTSDLHDITPSDNPINLCHKFIMEGMPEDEFAPGYSMNSIFFTLFPESDIHKYLKDLERVRELAHSKDIPWLKRFWETRGKQI